MALPSIPPTTESMQTVTRKYRLSIFSALSDMVRIARQKYRVISRHLGTACSHLRDAGFSNELFRSADPEPPSSWKPA